MKKKIHKDSIEPKRLRLWYEVQCAIQEILGFPREKGFFPTPLPTLLELQNLLNQAIRKAKSNSLTEEDIELLKRIRLGIPIPMEETINKFIKNKKPISFFAMALKTPKVRQAILEAFPDIKEDLESTIDALGPPSVRKPKSDVFEITLYSRFFNFYPVYYNAFAKIDQTVFKSRMPKKSKREYSRPHAYLINNNATSFEDAIIPSGKVFDNYERWNKIIREINKHLIETGKVPIRKVCRKYKLKKEALMPYIEYCEKELEWFSSLPEDQKEIVKCFYLNEEK